MSVLPESARLKKNKIGEEIRMRAAASSNPCSSSYSEDSNFHLDHISNLEDRHVTSNSAKRTDYSGVRLVDDCIDFINRNLNEKITLEDLASLCGRDKFQVIRTFRRALGTTPHAYIVEARVSRAAELLKSGEPAAEVASEVGFFDQSHLIRYFKRHVGTTPKQFVYQR